jgi:predicted ArsR family transcriptional regulator
VGATGGTLERVSTRRAVLLLLRRQPRSTVRELASELHLSGMGVRRHLDALAEAGLVRAVPSAAHRHGRPAAGWELTAAGCDALPHNYDRLALELLDDVTESLGPEALECVLAGRVAKVAAQYRTELDDDAPLGERVAWITARRDADGYLASWQPDDEAGPGDAFRLIEHHCAVRLAAERHPAVCAMELSLLQQTLGPGVSVVREHHALEGDPCCCYRISTSE